MCDAFIPTGKSPHGYFLTAFGLVVPKDTVPHPDRGFALDVTPAAKPAAQYPADVIYDGTVDDLGGTNVTDSDTSGSVADIAVDQISIEKRLTTAETDPTGPAVDVIVDLIVADDVSANGIRTIHAGDPSRTDIRQIAAHQIIGHHG